MPLNNEAIARTKEKFAVASANHIPPYNWIPPEKPPLLETLNQVAFPDDNLPQCGDIKGMQFEAGAKSDVLNPDQGKVKLSKLPNPDSDFEHVDPDQPGFNTAKNNAAFQRLKLAFDFIVCRTRELCLEINDAVTIYDADNAKTWDRYTNARQAYIEFLQNLDNHEPGPADLNKGRGYGKHYRWLFVDPVINEVDIKGVGTTNGSVKSLITGATIVLLWNPHSSSSGIPIKH